MQIHIYTHIQVYIFPEVYSLYSDIQVLYKHSYKYTYLHSHTHTHISRKKKSIS